MTDFLFLLLHLDWVFEQRFISATSTARVWLLFLTTFSYYYYFDWLFNYSLFPGLGKFFLEQLFYNTTTGRQTDFLTTLQLHYHY